MKYFEALKKWNEMRKADGKEGYSMPKKGSADYDAVCKMMGQAPKAVAEPKPKIKVPKAPKEIKVMEVEIKTVPKPSKVYKQATPHVQVAVETALENKRKPRAKKVEIAEPTNVVVEPVVAVEKKPRKPRTKKVEEEKKEPM